MSASPSSALSEHLEDFLRSTLCDNHLAAMALADGTPPAVDEVMRLAGQAQAVYMLSTLHCQSLPDRVASHQALWQQVHEFYQNAVQIWTDVPQDGELLTSYRHELEALQSVASDRCELYAIDDRY